MRKAEPCSGRVNSSGEQYYPIITAPKCGESSVSKSKGKNLRECLLFLLVFVIIANILLPGPDARISNGYSTVTPPHQTKLGLRPTRSYAWGVDPNFVDFQFHLYRIGQGLQAHAAKQSLNRNGIRQELVRLSARERCLRKVDSLARR